jgi:signal peptidase I
MILGLFKTSGHSMEPNIKEGSFFIASSIPYFFYSPKVGDIVLFKISKKNIFKRISKIENDKFIISGDNVKDSKKFDPIKRKEILGKLIWTF